MAAIREEKQSEPGWLLQFTPDGFEAKGESVRMLMQYAFGVGGDRISGGPPWLNTKTFTVHARLSPDVAEQIGKLHGQQGRLAHQQLLLNLLEARFHLVVRRESRSLPMYVLRVGRNGIKMRDNGQEVETADIGNSLQKSNLKLSEGEIEGRSVSLSTLVNLLSKELGRTVVDETKLLGRYDFDLKWTPESNGALAALIPGADSAGSNRNQKESNSTGISLITALAEQLGLDLAYANTPQQIIFVERAEIPSNN